jgi:hypothetical protein
METMRAFQVRLNGKRICLAGIGDDGVLSTTISYTPVGRRRETRLYVGGLVLPKDEHVKWKGLFLRLGDEVRVKLVEANAVDRPRQRYPRDRAAEAKAEQRHLRELAKKLGWKLCRISRPE